MIVASNVDANSAPRLSGSSSCPGVLGPCGGCSRVQGPDVAPPVVPHLNLDGLARLLSVLTQEQSVHQPARRVK